MKPDPAETPQPQPKPVGVLYYFGDPMCSWCWGFKPVLERVEREYPELQRVTVMGGLRRGPDAPMEEPLVAMISEGWNRIEATTGQPFNHEFWERHRPLATTLPACRAVLAARTLDAAREWSFMVGMFQAYFTELRDPSSRDTHLHVAEAVGFDRETFDAVLGSQAVEEALEKDLDWTETLGIRGFPTTVLMVNDSYYLISPGYQPIEEMRRAINKVYEANEIEFQRPESGLYA